MRANLDAFRRWRIVPRVLRHDLSVRDLSVEVLGTRMPAPVLLAPIGVQTLLHDEGELASARAAAAVGTPADHEHGIGDAAGGDRGGERRRAALVPALLAERRRARREPAPARRGRRLLGARPDHRQLPPGLEAARPRSRPICRSSRESGSPSTSPTRSSAPALEKPPEEDIGAAVGHFLGVFANPRLTWDGSSGCARRPRCRSCSRASSIPKTPARRASAASTGSSSRTTAAGRSTARSPRSTPCRRSWTRSGDEMAILLDSGIRSGADVVQGAGAGRRRGPARPALPLGPGARRPDGVETVLRSLLAELDLTMTLSGFTERARSTGPCSTGMSRR